MDVRNCKNCGKLYNYFGGQPFCPVCVNSLEDTFRQVKEYIYDHPEAGVQEISEEFKISVSIIHKWIREERLAFAESSAIGLACEGCGVTIKTGRFCKKCKNELANGLNNLYRREESPTPHKIDKKEQKMRFLR